MIRELYLYKAGGAKTLIDIDKVDIVRTYTSPYFGDVEKLKTDGTLSVTLPDTETNKAFFEYCDRVDMNSQIPYSYIYADYYVDGLTIFLNAECKVLSTLKNYEVQFVYGVNRAKYLPLFEKKLNEIVVGTGITSDNWIVKWDKTNMFANGKKYKMLNYISAEKTSDAQIYDNIVQKPVIAPEPYKSSQKEMTMHPFIPFNNILDLINVETGCAIDFTDLQARLTNKGLILGGNKDDIIDEYVITKNNEGFTSEYLPIVIPESEPDLVFASAPSVIRNRGFIYTSGTPILPQSKNVQYPLSVDFKFLFSIGNTIGTLQLWKFDGSAWGLSKEIAAYRDAAGFLYYDTVVTVEFGSESECYRFEFSNGSQTVTINGTITVTHKRTQSVFSLDYTQTFQRYNCLLNLPTITSMEFISEMLKITGMFIGYNESGEIEFYTFDEFKVNLQAGNVYDWSDKIQLLNQNFTFNSYAQKNFLKYNNWDKLNYVNTDYISVLNDTIEKEKDLHKIGFDLANRSANGISEFTLYKQTVTSDFKTPETKTFKNDYSEKDSVCVYDMLGTAINEKVLPNNGGIFYYATNDFSQVGIELGFTITDVISTYVAEFNSVINLSIGDRLTAIDSIPYVGSSISVIGISGLNVEFDTDISALLEPTPGSFPDITITKLYSNKIELAVRNDVIEVGDLITVVNGVNYTDLVVTAIDKADENNPIYTISDDIFVFEQAYNITTAKMSNGFKEDYYLVHQDIVEKSLVVDAEINLGFYESSKINKKYPIYAKEIGKYCILLEMQAPDNEVCTAKLLLINQTL